MLGDQVIDRHDLDALFDVLAGRGYTIVGPTIRDQAIVYDEIASSADLPVGWTDEQKVADRGFDLALTEVLESRRHEFVVEVGSDRGEEVLREVPHRGATEADRDAAEGIHQRTAAQMRRTLETDGIKELLYRNYEHPRWDEVADRCLTCGNCTMVCPTCFCTTVEDLTDLDGTHVERHQRWDSCFTVDYSHLRGVAVRGSPRSRYRQWMTPKLATWFDQFGSSGCVGCGRCITWCPVGIDITEEAAAIRASDGLGPGERAPGADA